MNKGFVFRGEHVFKEALPDLVVGLMGIPVAFSLQKVAEVTLHTRGLQKQGEGLLYFVLIILLYALYSAGLYMLFEIGLKLTQSKRGWQIYLVRSIFASSPITVLEVGALVGIGISFENPFVGLLGRPLNPRLLAVLAVTLPMILTFCRYAAVKREYSIVFPYYATVLRTLFVFMWAYYIAV